MSYNNSVNDTKKQEIMQIQTRSTRESINKKHFIPKNKVDNDTIENDSCLYRLPISIPKTYIKECHNKASIKSQIYFFRSTQTSFFLQMTP